MDSNPSPVPNQGKPLNRCLVPSQIGWLAPGGCVATPQLYCSAGVPAMPGGAGKADAIVAKGQAIDLPQGDFNKVYVIAALSSKV